MGWWQSLKRRWGIRSDARMAKLWVVFAITGSASAWVARPFTEWLGLGELPFWLRLPVRLIVILPFYQIVLLTLGTLAGERLWYTWFLKKLWRMTKAAPPDADKA